MNFRSIEKSDLEGCASIFERVFSTDPWNEPWDFKSAYRRLSHFFESKGFFGILAVTESDQVVGFALGNLEPFCNGQLYYLREMCVDCEHQGSGVGTWLVSHLKECLVAHGVKGTYLATGNQLPAAEFYQKNGYTLSEGMGFYFTPLNHPDEE